MTPRSYIVISAGMIALSFLQPAGQGYSAPLNGVPPAGSDVYHMELPGRGWAIEVGLPGFVIQQEEVHAQAQGAMMMGEKPNSGTYVSMFMEPRPTPATSKSLLLGGSGQTGLHCAHRTSTFRSCAFCEQEG